MTMSHLIALLEGLEVPNPELWVIQNPEALRALGKSISDTAKDGKRPKNTIHYRVALMSIDKRTYTVTADDDPEVIAIESNKYFVRWIDEGWQEAEV